MKFDLSQTKLIHRRTLKFPIKMSKELAELIGIHFGDGSLYKDLNHNYTLSYAGNLKKDRDYMNYIDFLFYNLFNTHLHTKIYIKQNSIELRLRSKQLFYFYKQCLKLCDGPKKNLSIPDYIICNKIFLRYFLRGLFDTDGCVVLQRSGKYSYLLIKISTKHHNFAKEIVCGLSMLGIHSFLLRKIGRGYASYEAVIRNDHVDTFFKHVGSKNRRNIDKYHLCLNIKRNGDAAI